MQDFLTIDRAGAEVSLDARNPGFYRNPNPTYAALIEIGPAFFWREQKQWYFTRYDAVNGLLRDRRFGRQITHIMSREEAGLGAADPSLADFDRAESKSLLELEPPDRVALELDDLDPGLVRGPDLVGLVVRLHLELCDGD